MGGSLVVQNRKVTLRQGLEALRMILGHLK